MMHPISVKKTERASTTTAPRSRAQSAMASNQAASAVAVSVAQADAEQPRLADPRAELSAQQAETDRVDMRPRLIVQLGSVLQALERVVREGASMKVIGITSAAILSLVLGLIAPAYAQHGRQGAQQGHAKQQQGKQERAQPRQQRVQRQPRQAPQRAQQHQRPQHAQQQHAQRQRGNQYQRAQGQQRVQKSPWQQYRARSWQSDHRSWQQRGGYNGYRIPDNQFRGYFGPEHGFRIYGLPFMVMDGRPRFQYRNYWFTLVDPWPGAWGNSWYENDDVYVNYVGNGYYLYDRRHPGVGIAISISL